MSSFKFVYRTIIMTLGSVHFQNKTCSMNECLLSPWTPRPRRSGCGTRASTGCPPQGRRRGSGMKKTLSAPAARCRAEPPAPPCSSESGTLPPLRGGPVQELPQPPEHQGARRREECPSTGSSSPGYPAASGRRGAGRGGR